MDEQKPILLSGLPRSGTTWTADVISHAKNVFYMHEPDNERLYLKTLFLKDGVHRYPYLKKGDESPLYFKLWQDLFHNRTFSEMFPKKYEVNAYLLERELGRKSGEIHESFFQFTSQQARNKTLKKRIDQQKKPEGKRLFIKSIYNMLALEWLASRFDFIPVVIIRHPANIISSYLKLKFPDSSRNIFQQEPLVRDYFQEIYPQIREKTDRVEKMAAQIGGIYHVLEKQLAHHPEWILLRHEDLCLDPIGRFKELYERLGLKWKLSTRRFIQERNRPGEGFKAKRVAEEEINKYQSLLDERQIKKIREVYQLFGNPFYSDI